MGWFDFTETRSNDTTSNAPTETFFKGNQQPKLNVNVSADEVLSIPVVQSILEIICGSIAQLPIYLYQKNSKDGSVTKIENDYRENILNNEPNPFETAYNLKKALVQDYLLYGVHRLYKQCKRNEVVALYNLPSDKTSVDKFFDNKFGFILKNYTINVNSEGGQSVLKPIDVITIARTNQDILEPKGVLEFGKKTFSLMIQEQKYQSSIYTNGAMPLGVIKSTGSLTEKTIDRLRQSWNSLYSGVGSSGKTVILEEGLDYKALSYNPNDLSIIDSKKNNISEVCRLFNIPESLVNSNANKYGSIEQNNISFLQYTLSPILTSIENALNKDLLLEDEKQKGYFFNFDTSEILKTTEQEKYDAIKSGLDSGAISINEARVILRRKPIKDDVMKWSLGSVLYNPENGSMMIPNLGLGIPNIDGKEKVQNNKNVNNKETVQDTTNGEDKENIENKGE